MFLREKSELSHNVDQKIISVCCAGCNLRQISVDTHIVVDVSSSSLVNSTSTPFLFFFSGTVGPTVPFVYFLSCLNGLCVTCSLRRFTMSTVFSKKYICSNPSVICKIMLFPVVDTIHTLSI